MGLEFKLKVFGRELEGKPFFKRVSLDNTHKYFYNSKNLNARSFLFIQHYNCIGFRKVGRFYRNIISGFRFSEKTFYCLSVSDSLSVHYLEFPCFALFVNLFGKSERGEVEIENVVYVVVCVNKIAVDN